MKAPSMMQQMMDIAPPEGSDDEDEEEDEVPQNTQGTAATAPVDVNKTKTPVKEAEETTEDPNETKKNK